MKYRIIKRGKYYVLQQKDFGLIWSTCENASEFPFESKNLKEVEGWAEYLVGREKQKVIKEY